MLDSPKPCPKCGNLALTKYSTSCWFCNKELPPIYPGGGAGIRPNDYVEYKMPYSVPVDVQEYLDKLCNNKLSINRHGLSKCKVCGYIGYGNGFKVHKCNRGGE